MKRVFALLLCLCLIVSVFAACTPEAGNGGDVTTGGNDGGEKHVHTYETTWSKDAEGHWYEATCECEDLEITKTAHTDKDQDKACDVCGYTEHTHTYTEDWQSDAQNHWHAPDCGCPIDNIDTAAHVDANKDGKCDVCAYVIEEHVHQFATEWSSDEAYHWHATTCGHDEAITDKAPHRINDAGLCTVCGMQLEVIDPSDIKAVLGAAVALDDKVTDGKVIFNEMPNGNFGRRNEVVYTLGNGQAYIIYSSLDENDNHLQDLHQWAERLSDDNIFAVQRDGADGEFTVVAGSPHLLTGYNYMPGNLLSAGYDDVNTLALFVYNMYDQMSNGTNVMNAVENYDAENGNYTFSYEWFFADKQTSGGEVFNISVEYFVVDVKFTIDETGVINDAGVTVTTYRNWEMDCDLDYDQETNTVTLRDTATPTIYDYTVTQTSGERTFENPYSKDVMIPSDFELYYVTGTDYNDDDGHQYIVSEELIEGTLTLEKGEYVRLHLNNLIPSTALPDFMDTSDFEFTFTNKTEGATGDLWKDEDFLRPSYNPLTLNSITFKVADPGEYTMTIRFGKVTKTIEITVPGETVSELPESDASNVYVETTDTYAWDVDSFTYTAAESGTYTFNLPAGLGIRKSGEIAPAVDFDGNTSGRSYSVDIAAGNSVEFFVAAKTKGVWHITVDFVAGDVGGGDTPGGGDEPGGDPTSVTITPGTYDLEGNTLVINADGTMVFTYGTFTHNYTYAVDGTTVTYTLNGNAPYTADNSMAMHFGYFTFDADGNAKGFYYNGNEYALTAGGDNPGGDDIGGDTTVTITGSYVSSDNVLKVEFDGNSVTFTHTHPMSGFVNVLTFNYTVVDGVVSLIDPETGDAAPAMYGITLTDGVPTEAIWEGFPMAISEDTGDQPGGDEPGGDEPVGGDEIKDSLYLQKPVIGDYNLMFLYNEDDGYYVNIYGDGFDLYFTYNVENVGGNDYAITVTYFARPDFETNPDMAATIETEVFNATYDGVEWSFAGGDQPGGDEPGGTDTLKDSLAYQMPTVGSYNLMFLPYDETNGYLVNVYGTGFDLYFTYNVENVSGDRYAITVTYFARPDFESGAEMAETIETEVFYATYDGIEWAFEGSDVGGGDDIGGNGTGAEDDPYIITIPGDFTCEFPGGYWAIWYAFTATENGTVTLSTTFGEGGWLLLGTSPMWADSNSGTGESLTIAVTAGTTYYVGVGDWDEQPNTVPFTLTFEANGGSGDAGDDEGEDEIFTSDLVIGNNNIEGADINFAYTATEDGTLTLDLGVAIMGPVEAVVLVNGSVAETLYTETGVTLNLYTGDVVTVEVTAEGYATIIASWAAAGGSDAPAGPAGSGTSNDPWVIETLPAELTHSGNHDVYYTFTATEDCTIVITYTAGAYVSGLPSNFEKDSAARTWTGTVTAGQVLSINPWASSDATYTIAVATPVEPEQPGEGEGEGEGDVTATTYLASHENGRKMKVVVYSNGTLEITRSDMTGNFTGGASTSTYTWAMVDGTFTVSGTGSATGIEFTNDGVPVKLYWFGAEYNNFELQA